MILDADCPELLDNLRRAIEETDLFPGVRVVSFPAVLIEPEKENKTT